MPDCTHRIARSSSSTTKTSLFPAIVNRETAVHFSWHIFDIPWADIQATSSSASMFISNTFTCWAYGVVPTRGFIVFVCQQGETYRRAGDRWTVPFVAFSISSTHDDRHMIHRMRASRFTFNFPRRTACCSHGYMTWRAVEPLPLVLYRHYFQIPPTRKSVFTYSVYRSYL